MHPRTVALCAALLVLGAGSVRAEDPASGHRPRMERVATYVMKPGAAAEIVSVQQHTARALLTDANARTVDLIDLTGPTTPKRIARHTLLATDGEELTSVAFHPTEDWFLAVLRAADPKAPGRLLAVGATDGALLGSYAVGTEPDAVAIAPDGKTAVVANEAETYWRDPATGAFRSLRGGCSIADLSNGPGAMTLVTFTLKDQTRKSGFTKAAHGRSLERAIDLNGDGRIEGDAETKALVRLDSQHPMHLEPEYVAYAPNSRRAYVTLQENNGVIVIDVVKKRVIAAWGLGTTTHAADTDNDGTVRFDRKITALREPDGIALTPTGRFFVTADEGDTEPKAAKSKGKTLVGGGRTLSVFDALTGRFIGDTGNQLDLAAHMLKTYDDDRSDNKGSEPENVVTFHAAGVTYAVVGLERAEALALVSLADPTKPRVVGAYRLRKKSISPEGLAVLRRDGAIYVLSANEISGDMTVFRFRP
ncbi:MAG: hypothetical protein QNJ98_06475 [Planctomycetota bacterium]|nr:hypothetical protein [Planctomycetota bacterium]